MITVTASVWQFPLIGLGMAALLVCAVSPRLPFRRIAVPGAAFIASIAYSAYLVQKLVIHFVAQFLATQNISPTSLSGDRWGPTVRLRRCDHFVPGGRTPLPPAPS